MSHVCPIHRGTICAMVKGALRLKREPDRWQLRVYAGRDPIKVQPRYDSRSFRGGKLEANSVAVTLRARGWVRWRRMPLMRAVPCGPGTHPAAGYAR
jgi:hypothetical protein